MNVTSKQKEMLLVLLKENAELIRGRINRKEYSVHRIQRLHGSWTISQHVVLAQVYPIL